MLCIISGDVVGAHPLIAKPWSQMLFALSRKVQLAYKYNAGYHLDLKCTEKVKNTHTQEGKIWLNFIYFSLLLHSSWSSKVKHTDALCSLSNSSQGCVRLMDSPCCLSPFRAPLPYKVCHCVDSPSWWLGLSSKLFLICFWVAFAACWMSLSCSSPAPSFF